MAAGRLISILTLGCKLNLADSDALARGLAGAGFQVTDKLCEADGFVINTCTVTQTADQKTRKLVRTARRLAPRAQIAVTGCFPRTAPASVVRDLGVDLVAGNRDADRALLIRELGRSVAAGSPQTATGAGQVRRLRTRAFIKVQEGCNDVCAFCIVPRTRGRERSRSIAVVAADVAAAVAAGAMEVVLTGTQLGAWGKDLEPRRAPADLIAGVLAHADVPRLRFSSLQPQDITPALVGLWRDPRLMPHFHLALQSGSDHVLALMRRRYNASQFRAAVELVRAASPDAAITTDIIAGFPGESEDDFAATMAMVEWSAFARVHAFPYSPRPGTAAARLPGTVLPDVQRRRLGELLRAGERQALRFRGRFLGTARPVLWEAAGRTAGQPRRWTGYTDNYLHVEARSSALLDNRITYAALRAGPGTGCVAEIEDE